MNGKLVNDLVERIPDLLTIIYDQANSRQNMALITFERFRFAPTSRRGQDEIQIHSRWFYLTFLLPKPFAFI